MSIRIHAIENAPPALLDYVFFGSLVATVIAFVIVFRFGKKSQSGPKSRNPREGKRRRAIR
jgi:hypothetical protein